ncbi:MAG: LytTR family DNA-binding domain-containing protein [Lachnospiraceae bacterium]|nr:LytTR family DNA-binding domain-containing protein [Lachnospiraceae bacterium]
MSHRKGGIGVRIAVCDDSVREQERVVQLLLAQDSVGQPECFTSGKNLLEAAAKAPPFDIVFLDVYMPGENGVETAESLQALSPSTGIVFVTTSKDYAVDAFSLRALHYLVKPVTAGGVEESLRRLAEFQKKRSPVIVFPSGSGSYTVAVDEINYIQSVGHVKELVLTGGKVIRVWMSMEEMEKKLDNTFLKLNRSLIVNMEKIEQMGTAACMLRDGTRLEFARRERAAIHAAYDNYLFNRLDGRKEWGVTS